MADQKAKSALEVEFENVKGQVHKQVSSSMFGKGLLPLVTAIFNFMGKIVEKVDRLETEINSRGK
mgnify:FL=1